MIGLGFFWIFCATVLGSLVGARINAVIAHDVGDWLQSLQKMLLVSAHAHMNLMAIVTILVGLTLNLMWGQVSRSLLNLAIFLNIFSMPVFVFGILLDALFIGQYQLLFTGIIALGAAFYIISIGILASIFAFLFFKK